MLSRASWMSWLFVAPALIIIAVLMYYPMLGTVIESFYSASFINPDPTFVGLGNYREVFADGAFVKIVWNSIVWTIDGVAYAQATPDNLVPNAEWVFNSISSYQIVLDLVVGGWPCDSSSPVAPPNPCPGASFPAQMVVNWVHVYH